MHEAPNATEVKYLVLSDGMNPYLLARVRWPDVAQAISAERPDWQYDPGLFDLPYDPSSATVTHASGGLYCTSVGSGPQHRHVSVRLHPDPAYAGELVQLGACREACLVLAVPRTQSALRGCTAGPTSARSSHPPASQLAR